MDQRMVSILFALLRSAIRGMPMSEEERDACSPELLRDVLGIATKHDVAHLLAVGLKQNGLVSGGIDAYILKAVYRHERTQCECDQLCSTLENAGIPFLPLKGAVLRGYYPEAWMRTSCDIDVLVRRDDLDRAVACLTETLNYEEKGRETHDVSLFSPMGIHVELHFDLVEEGRANGAIDVLRSVWDNVSLHEPQQYWYDMSDAFFYFYHIAHMAKHFECGGCGIRPFIDLWILDGMENADRAARDALLAKGGLLQFANASRALSGVWFGGAEEDALSQQLQDFLLHGGSYGSADNRVALQQRNKGGRIGYMLSRIFIPYHKLRRYYPILEKHKWLMPVMQVRRWFMLLNPDIARMAKKEIQTNRSLDQQKATDMQSLLDRMGL